MWRSRASPVKVGTGSWWESDLPKGCSIRSRARDGSEAMNARLAVSVVSEMSGKCWMASAMASRRTATAAPACGGGARGFDDELVSLSVEMGLEAVEEALGEVSHRVGVVAEAGVAKAAAAAEVVDAEELVVGDGFVQGAAEVSGGWVVGVNGGDAQPR